MRPGWDEYFLNMLDAVSKRATCDRGKSAAVITKNNRMISTGYVGSVSGQPHCDEVGHLFTKQFDEDGIMRDHCTRTLHSECNAIAFAARYGVSIDGATMYCTMEPCISCSKLIIASGIIRVVCLYEYQSASFSRKLLKDANIILDVVNKKVMEY